MTNTAKILIVDDDHLFGNCCVWVFVRKAMRCSKLQTAKLRLICLPANQPW